MLGTGQGISRRRAGAEQLRSDLAPEVARQHTRNWGHDDEQPEGRTGGHHLLKEMENALGQVLREHSIDQHVHKPDDCIAQKTWI